MSTHQPSVGSGAEISAARSKINRPRLPLGILQHGENPRISLIYAPEVGPPIFSGAQVPNTHYGVGFALSLSKKDNDAEWHPEMATEPCPKLPRGPIFELEEDS